VEGHEHPGPRPTEGREEQAGEGVQGQQHIPVLTKHPSSKDLSRPGQLGVQIRLCVQDLFTWLWRGQDPSLPGARAVPPVLQPELGFTARSWDAEHGLPGREPEKAFAFCPDFPS